MSDNYWKAQKAQWLSWRKSPEESARDRAAQNTLEAKLSLAVSALESAKEKLERSDDDGTQSDTYWEVVNTLAKIKEGK